MGKDKYGKDDADLRSYRSAAADARSHRSGRSRKPAASSSAHQHHHHHQHRPRAASASPERKRTLIYPSDSISVAGVSRLARRSGGDKEKDKDRQRSSSSRAGSDDGRSKRSGGSQLDLVFRAKPRHGDNMLKAIFKGKKDKDAASSSGGKREMVLA
ncbi:hypothetical protein CDD83_3148 [Cordyceps sp. RAO-2017]|nr:hypothetical protein CDD83_3148 [Cordyceps sp. RAO-2017]